MSSVNNPNPLKTDSVYVETPTFIGTLRRTFPFAVGGFICGTSLFALLSLAQVFGAAPDFQVVALITNSVIAGLSLGGACWLFKWLTHSRSLTDKIFRAVALSTTFFGFMMLVVFFVGMGHDGLKWFEYVPDAVAEQNEDVKIIQERLAHPDREIQKAMEEVDREMEIELSRIDSEEEKAELRKFYEDEIKPNAKTNLLETFDELEQTAPGDIRSETDPASLMGHFLTHGPSAQPQDAGISVALLGSVWIGVLTILLALPLGVGAAIYLEEYRQDTWAHRIIQVNISNLAGVPSVVYGILGAFLFVELLFKQLEGELYTPAFLQFLLGEEWANGLMRTIFGEDIAARNLMGGGMTLALLTLPVVIVSSQQAIRAVPDSIRHGAMALGATRWQVTWHHVLPQSRAGILTGIILALSRALGESAPLVFFGALLFVNHEPAMFSRFTVLPLQIFGWAERPDEIWKYNAAMASIVLLGTILALNAIAIYLRYRAQRAPTR